MMQDKALASPTEGTAPSGKFDGVWRNELNSTMTLTITGSKVEGTYESPVSSTGDPARGDLTGFAHGDHISFIVNWSTGSLTAWVGQLVTENGTAMIQTLWQMIKAPGEGEDSATAWQSILSGADQFRR